MIELTVNGAGPVFDTMSGRVAFWPTVTLPKESEDGLTPILGVVTGAEVYCTEPAQTMVPPAMIPK